MAVSKEIKQAKVSYDNLCKMLNEHKWNYDEDKDNLMISCGVQGDDLPINIIIKVDPGQQIVSLISNLQLSIPEEKRVEIALAVSAINYVLVDGSFDYNYMDGTLLFRMTSSFRGSLLGNDVFEYMLFVACKTIDDYNDKFLMLLLNKMTLDDFINLINK